MSNAFREKVMEFTDTRRFMSMTTLSSLFGLKLDAREDKQFKIDTLVNHVCNLVENGNTWESMMNRFPELKASNTIEKLMNTNPVTIDTELLTYKTSEEYKLEQTNIQNMILITNIIRRHLDNNRDLSELLHALNIKWVEEILPTNIQESVNLAIHYITIMLEDGATHNDILNMLATIDESIGVIIANVFKQREISRIISIIDEKYIHDIYSYRNTECIYKFYMYVFNYTGDWQELYSKFSDTAIVEANNDTPIVEFYKIIEHSLNNGKTWEELTDML